MTTRRRHAALGIVTLAAGLLLPVLVVGLAQPAASAPRVDDQRARTVVLDGVEVRLRPGTQQVVTVNHTGGHHARVTFWKATDEGWVARFDAEDGRIGYGGLVVGHQRKQGTGTTPLGTYRLPFAFGHQERRQGWRLRYREVRAGDFWVQDNASRWYNRYRNQAQGGFRWWLPSSDPNSSERLTDYRPEYDLSVVIDFNRSQVRHRGAGIFLHVNGPGATAGCVSAPRRFLQRTMAALDPALETVIAIGR